jgi:class 3 adenylate cyclase/predicted ATPase
MICAQCGTETSPGERCERCRAVLGAKECPECHASLFGKERFCPRCGRCFAGSAVLLAASHMKRLEQYLPERVLERLLQSDTGILSERRYATVMFADVSGFTSMSEEMSAEAVAETMNGVFDGLVAAVHRYDGTVDKFIGDAVMAIFGAPVSHDNDPERAVCTALEMQSFIREHAEKIGRKISLAIGINAGPLVAGSMGGHGRLNYSVLGDTVNTAQRLEVAAGAGRILVTREVYKRAKDTVRFKTVAPIKVKGKRNPIDVWEVRERRPRSGTQLKGRTLIGRQPHLEKLEAAVEKGASLVAVVGDNGVGRSSLVQQLAELAEKKGVLVVSAVCPPYAAEASAGPLSETVAQLLKVRIDQGPGAISDGRSRLIEMGLTEQEASLLLAGAARDKPDSAELGYEATLRATCAAWHRVLATYAAKGKVQAILEDLQWASPTSRAQLEIVLDRAPPRGVTVVATMRPEAAGLPGANAELLTVGPLDAEDARAMVADRLGLALVEEPVAQRVWELTRGNPRLIDELLQSFIDQGVVFRSRQHWIVSPRFVETPMPASIEGLVSARLDELDTEARRFVQAAAVIGSRFDPEMVRRVGGLQIDLEWVLSQLIDRRIVSSEDARGAELRFAHEAYRSVAAASLTAKDAQVLHGRAGQYLADTTELGDPRNLSAVAHHFARGHDKEKAARFLLRAAKRCVEVHQVDSAVELLEELIALAAPNGYRNYDLSRCENELDEALYRLGLLHLLKGEIERADEELQWAYGRARQFFNGDFRVWSLLALARLSVQKAQHDEARRFLEMAGVDAEGMKDAGLQAVSLLEQARLANAEKRWDAALAAVVKGLELDSQIGDRNALPERISPALLVLERAAALHGAGKPADANEAYLEAHMLAEAVKDPSAQAHASLALAKLSAARGEFAEARAHTQDALACFRAVGDRVGEGRTVHDFALMELMQGETARAAKAAAMAERIFTEIGHREGLALVAEVRARCNQGPVAA